MASDSAPLAQCASSTLTIAEPFGQETRMGWPIVVPATVGTVLHVALSPGRADSGLPVVGAPGYVAGRVANAVVAELSREEGVFMPAHPAHRKIAVRTKARQRFTLQLCTLEG